MGIDDAENSRPVPVLADLRGWLDDSPAAVRALDYLREENRIRKEQLGCRRLRLNDGQRRRLGVQRETDWSSVTGAVCQDRDAGAGVGLASETDCPEVRRNCPACTGATPHRRRGRGRSANETIAVAHPRHTAFRRQVSR